MTALKYLLVCIFTCSALSVEVFANEAKRCQQPAAVLEVVEGRVDAKFGHSGEWLIAKVGTELCYGDFVKIVEARAALRLQNDTLVRLNQDTTVRFLEPKASFWVELIEGVAHFISRTPRSFEVTSPYLNAAVDGTEFIVTASSQRAQVYVVEGQVTANNDFGAVQLMAAQAASAIKGQPPQLDLGANLLNSVSWAFHYPLLSSLTSVANINVQNSIDKGDFLTALNLIEPQPTDIDRLPWLNLVMALNLTLGRIDRAIEVNKKALAEAPNSAEANAVSTLMELIRGDRELAAQRSEKNVQSNPGNVSVLLVDSYVQQALFDLEGAYTSAIAAAELLPTDGMLWVRVAELALNLDEVSSAEEALARAESINFISEQLATFKGVILLKALKFKAARTQFLKAVEINNQQPLAHFLLGLTQIRLGKQDIGRQQVELAVLLDPNNSLYRSYLGKIFYDESRFSKAVDQFNLAKQLDPKDPTPYFYQAVQYQALGRPTKAMYELKESIVRNDNRAVYRSRMQLDSDYGARSASLADVYLDLGLNEQAVREAEKAKRVSSNEFSPYKIMADIRAREPRSARAAASEYLQAQMRQPLTSIPIRPLLAESGLAVLPGAGPSSLGLSEYNPLMSKNKNNFLLSVASGSESTTSYDAMVSGLVGRQSYLLESYASGSAGESGLDGLDYKIHSLFYQIEPSAATSIFLDFKSKTEELFRQKKYEINVTSDLEHNLESVRLGVRHFADENLSLFSSLNYTNGDSVDSFITVFFEGTPIRSELMTLDMYDYEHIDVELSANWMGNNWQGQAGVQRNEYSNSGMHYVGGVIEPENAEPLAPSSESVVFTKYFASVNYDLSEIAAVEFGLSNHSFDAEVVFDRKVQMLAKSAGVSVTPLGWLNVDLVYFENFSPPSYLDQTLEKTHIFGVSKFSDETSASESEVVELRLVGAISDWDFSFSSFDKKVMIPLVEHEEPGRKYLERGSSFRLSRVFRRFVMELSADISSVDMSGRWGATDPLELDSKAIPLSVTWFGGGGFSFDLQASRVWQARVSSELAGRTKESFTVVDFSASYLLSGVAGKSIYLSLDVKNATDETFAYQSANSLTTEAQIRAGYAAEKTVVGRLTWLF